MIYDGKYGNLYFITIKGLYIQHKNANMGFKFFIFYTTLSIIVFL